jgi:hypothetical protein
MTLGTRGDVEEIQKVQDEEGNLVPPSNANIDGNRDSLEAFQYSTGGTTPEALDAYDVPHGVDVLVLYQPTNSDVVRVGSESEQPVILEGTGQGVSLAVTDTSEIHVHTPTAGDSVGVLFEK